MSRSKTSLFPKHHILGVLGLANVRQHIPQLSWETPGRDTDQGSGHSLPNTRSGTALAWGVTWCQGKVSAHRHCCGFLVASHLWKQSQRGNCLSQFTSLRGVPVWTPDPQRFWTVGVSGTAKSQAQGFQNIPALSEREHRHHPPSGGICCQPPPRPQGFKHRMEKIFKITESSHVSLRCQYVSSSWTALLLRMLLLFPTIPEGTAHSVLPSAFLTLPNPLADVQQTRGTAQPWCSCPAGSTALVIPNPTLQPSSGNSKPQLNTPQRSPGPSSCRPSQYHLWIRLGQAPNPGKSCKTDMHRPPPCPNFPALLKTPDFSCGEAHSTISSGFGKICSSRVF